MHLLLAQQVAAREAGRRQARALIAPTPRAADAEHRDAPAVQRLNPQVYDLSLMSLKAVYLPTVTSLFGEQHKTSAPTTLFTGGALVTTSTATLIKAAGRERAARVATMSAMLAMAPTATSQRR